MFPLPRMLEYGNTRSVPYIKQMQFGFSSSVTNMILLSTGDAYVGGSNTSGQLGLGDKSDRPRQLFKVQEQEIKMIACSVSSTLYISKDDKIYLSGDRAILNASGTVSGWTTYTDISSYFSTINIADIKKISLESTAFVLMNNGDLYGLGLNRYGELGLGSTGYKPLSLVATDVMDCAITAQNSMYIKNDGTVWSAGRNSYYCLQTSTDGGVIDAAITTFKQMFSTVQEPILHVRLSTSNIMAFTENKLYCTGSNGSGAFGDGNIGSNTNTTGIMITVNLTKPCQKTKHFDIAYVSHAGLSMYVGTDNLLYSTGNNYNGSLGLGLDTQYIGTYTVVPDVVIGGTDIILNNYYNAYIARTENIILGCGNNKNPTCLTNDVFTNKFTSLQQLPWRT